MRKINLVLLVLALLAVSCNSDDINPGDQVSMEPDTSVVPLAPPTTTSLPDTTQPVAGSTGNAAPEVQPAGTPKKDTVAPAKKPVAAPTAVSPKPNAPGGVSPNAKPKTTTKTTTDTIVKTHTEVETKTTH